MKKFVKDLEKSDICIDLVNELRELHKMLFDAHANYCLLKILLNKNKYKELKDGWRNFFIVFCDNCLMRIFILISCLYEDDSRALSIFKVRNIGQSQQVLSVKTIRYIDGQTREINEELGSIKKIRDKVAAHRDKNISVPEIFKSSNLRIEGIDRTLEVGLQILNRVASELSDYGAKKYKWPSGIIVQEFCSICEKLDKEIELGINEGFPYKDYMLLT